MFLWYYIAYRVFRGNRPYRPYNPGNPTVFSYLFAGVVMFIIFGALTALFIAEGPLFIGIPLALATLFVVVLTWANIAALKLPVRPRGESSETKRNGV